MITVEIARTTPLFPTAVFLQWRVAAEHDDAPGPYFYSVDRAGAPDGPWESVAVSLRDVYSFVDDRFNLPPPSSGKAVREGVNQFSLSRDIYYRVTVTDAQAQPLAVSPSLSVEPGLDRRTRLLKRKILYDESVAFRHLNGLQLYVLKRRQWGERCDVCWDPATKESTQEKCSTCFGTTYKGGYWTPVLIRGRRDPAPVQAQMSPHGKTERRATAFTILDYPLIEQDDIIVERHTNERWIVEMVTRTELKGVPVHQKATCSNLDRSSVQYTVPVDRLSNPPLY